MTPLAHRACVSRSCVTSSFVCPKSDLGAYEGIFALVANLPVTTPRAERSSRRSPRWGLAGPHITPYMGHIHGLLPIILLTPIPVPSLRTWFLVSVSVCIWYKQFAHSALQKKLMLVKKRVEHQSVAHTLRASRGAHNHHAKPASDGTWAECPFISSLLCRARAGVTPMQRRHRKLPLNTHKEVVRITVMAMAGHTRIPPSTHTHTRAHTLTALTRQAHTHFRFTLSSSSHFYS